MIECSCMQQMIFKMQLIRLIYDRTVLEDEEFLENMDNFVNRWCPTLKDCPCKHKEGGL